jgi:hypothetical protein
MSRGSYLLMGILGLLAVCGAAAFQHSPGYMDADYYYMGGTRLAGGYGFTEEILWNYLDDPAGVPHPSHGYWMPLVSLLAAAGMLISGKIEFSSALIFILLAACIPPHRAALRLCRRRERRCGDSLTARFLHNLPPPILRRLLGIGFFWPCH